MFGVTDTLQFSLTNLDTDSTDFLLLRRAQETVWFINFTSMNISTEKKKDSNSTLCIFTEAETIHILQQ